jgi:hypothetical protein
MYKHTTHRPCLVRDHLILDRQIVHVVKIVKV